jgi:hypothetical protein
VDSSILKIILAQNIFNDWNQTPVVGEPIRVDSVKHSALSNYYFFSSHYSNFPEFSMLYFCFYLSNILEYCHFSIITFGKSLKIFLTVKTSNYLHSYLLKDVPIGLG